MMKTKLLFSAALATMLCAACSQDEVVEQSAGNAGNKDLVSNRVAAGKVSLSTDFGDMDSRFVQKNGKFEKGDVLGLYLMDEFQDSHTGTYTDKDGKEYAVYSPGENTNANNTHWKYQTTWWDMYKLVNNIQSNYPFSFDGQKWENDAVLVEGNYFAMYPQQKLATNRRDLWHYVNPNITLTAEDAANGKKFYGLDNQFFLGYSQIYRDVEANGNGGLNIPLHMKYIMPYLRINLTVRDANNFKLTKVVFRRADNKKLPTIAYVEPADSIDASIAVDESMFPANYDCDGNITVIWGAGLSVLDNGYFNDAKFTRKVARSLVSYRDNKVPYGFKGENSAYAYTFNLPGEGFELLGNTQNAAQIVVALPNFNETQWKDIKVEFYGYQKQTTVNGHQWVYGVISDNDDDNSILTVDQFKAWEEDKVADARVDLGDLYFKNLRDGIVSSSDELYNQLNAILNQSGSTVETKNIELSIAGDRIDISKETAELIEKYNAKHTQGTVVTLKALSNSNVRVTLPSGKDALELFKYGEGVSVETRGTQTAKSTISADILNRGTLIVTEDAKLANVDNSGVVEVEGKIDTLTNNRDAFLKNDAKITSLNNHSKVEVAGEEGKAVEVATLYNYVDCDRCDSSKDTPAIIDVLEDATLKSTSDFKNEGAVNVYGTVALTGKERLNVGTIKNEGEILVGDGTGYEGNAITFKNGGNIQNEGTIKTSMWNILKNDSFTYTLRDKEIKCTGLIINGGEKAGKILTTSGNQFHNNSIIEAHKGLINQLKNLSAGKLRVMEADNNEVMTSDESKGEIIYVGVKAQHISTKGEDKQIFELTEAMTTADINGYLEVTGANNVRTTHDITFVANSIKEHKFGQLAEIEVYNDAEDAEEAKVVVFKGEKTNMVIKLGSAKINVGTNVHLHIENATTVETDGDVTGTVHTGSNSKLNGGSIQHK